MTCKESNIGTIKILTRNCSRAPAMPVSLDRLIAESEAGVITDELIREGIVVGSDLLMEGFLGLCKSCVMPLQCFAHAFRSRPVALTWQKTRRGSCHLTKLSVQPSAFATSPRSATYGAWTSSSSCSLTTTA